MYVDNTHHHYTYNNVYYMYEIFEMQSWKVKYKVIVHRKLSYSTLFEVFLATFGISVWI